jgi:16S rRNA (cytosine967-C5)-methyltransferase
MSVRTQAARVLATVLKRERSLASALPLALENVSDQDQPLLQELCYGTLRQLPRLQLLAEKLLKKPFKTKDSDLYALLLIGLYQLLYTRIPPHAAISETVNGTGKLHKQWAKGLINGVLRSCQRAPQLLESLQADDVFRCAHPPWLIAAIRSAWPDHWEQILEQNNQQGPLTLRVNARQTSREGYARQLEEQGIAFQLCEHSPQGITLARAQDVTQLPGFNEGRASVQDEAAQLAASLLELAPGQRVLDACAAPGGKTCHILETEPDLEYCLAIDASSERLLRVQDNFDRTRLHCDLKTANAVGNDWWDEKVFDRILLDAPCSATGVIRRNPDIKHLRLQTDIAPLATLQMQILENLWTMLAPGGLLVYATCSLLPQENEQLISQFLAHEPSAIERPIAASWGIPRGAGRQLFPQPVGHDGFYYAVLEKRAQAHDAENL